MIKMWKTGGVRYVSIAGVEKEGNTFKQAFEAHGVTI